MKTLFYLSLALVAVSCQKEIVNKQANFSQPDQAVAVNDTVYFEGLSFTGGIGIVWANHWSWAYWDSMHLPYVGCKIAYIRFKVNHQNGAIVNSLRANIDDDFNIIARRHLQAKAAGDTVIFKYATPRLIAGNRTSHELEIEINQNYSYGWTRVMPDSISILGSNNKPLPIKGFLHSDYPVGTPLTAKNVTD
jgi:hypothetical protein